MRSYIFLNVNILKNLFSKCRISLKAGKLWSVSFNYFHFELFFLSMRFDFFYECVESFFFLNLSICCKFKWCTNSPHKKKQHTFKSTLMCSVGRNLTNVNRKVVLSEVNTVIKRDEVSVAEYVPQKARDEGCWLMVSCPTFVQHELVPSLSLIHIWRCRRIERCRSRWSPYH